MLLKDVGAVPKYTVCMNESLACVITFSRGSMLRLAKSGAVCAVYEEFVIILMAFFCWRNILLMFV
jgi:hypothetical protein